MGVCWRVQWSRETRRTLDEEWLVMLKLMTVTKTKLNDIWVKVTTTICVHWTWQGEVVKTKSRLQTMEASFGYEPPKEGVTELRWLPKRRFSVREGRAKTDVTTLSSVDRLPPLFHNTPGRTAQKCDGESRETAANGQLLNSMLFSGLYTSICYSGGNSHHHTLHRRMREGQVKCSYWCAR